MTGIASYITSSPRHMLVLLIVSASVVATTQFLPLFGNSSASPGVGAEIVTGIENSEFTALFSPRSVPEESTRGESFAGDVNLPVFGQPSDEPVEPEEETVVQIEISVPEDPAVLQGGVSQPLLLRPTFSWVNVFSDSSSIAGELVGVGDVITAFDPEGTLVGHFTVVTPGRFGLMALYQDDPTTSVDEGANPGDEISFEINGIPVVAIGPQEPIWTSNGSLLLINLAGA